MKIYSSGLPSADTEQREILEAFESGKVKRAKDAAETQKRHQKYAEAMFKKDARINIRLPSRDLRGLQKKALAEGIPYQTLVASILHKYVEGRLHESAS
jgi:predicted DNA binding CopG/RHH family protein